MTEFFDLLPKLLEQTGITLVIVFFALLIGGALGLVVGVLLTVTRAGALLAQPVVYGVLNVLVNTFRPIPFIILLAALQPLGRVVVGKGIGDVYAIFVISFAAVFGIARIVEQNLVAVDPGVIEAARAAGAGPLRIIVTVIIPEGLGPLILGYTFALVAIVDMSAVAGLVGGNGIGNYAVVYGYRQFDAAVTWSAVALVIIIVQVIQLGGNLLARKVLRR